MPRARKKTPPRSVASADRNVDRLVSILAWVGSQRSWFSVPELSRAVSVPYCTVWRWMRALEAQGLVERELSSIPFGAKGSGYRLRSCIRLVRKR